MSITADEDILNIVTYLAFLQTTNDVRIVAADQTVATPVLTIPDLTGVSGDLVVTNAVQTFTNKTITDSTNTITADGLRTTAGGGTVAISTNPTTAGQKLISTGPNDAAWIYDPLRQPVRVATTANGSLASDFEDGDTVDGVVLAEDDRILIKNQTTGTENGIYIVAASGAPSRAEDFDTGEEVASTLVVIQEGSSNADTLWLCTNNPGSDVVGTNTILFTNVTGSGGGGGSGKIAYPILTFQANGRSTGWQTIAYWSWLNSSYSSYSNGLCILEVEIVDRNLDIRLRDTTNNVTLGSSLNIASSSFVSFAVSNPGSNARVELQVQKTAEAGIDPQVFGATLQFDT